MVKIRHNPIFVKKGKTLQEYAADVRWQKENGGLDVNGIVVATDDRSKTLISGARIKADSDPDFTTPWVAKDGSIYTLDATQIIGISDAVLAHVAGCFQTYADIVNQINSGEITTYAQIDEEFA